MKVCQTLSIDHAHNVANMDRKRKHVVLSIESKLTVLDSVAKGVGYSELCEKFGIGKSTITTLKKNEAKIP